MSSVSVHNRTNFLLLPKGLDALDVSSLTDVPLPPTIEGNVLGGAVQRLDRSVSPAQLARALGLGESTLKRWIDQGRVPAEKTPGGHRRIRLSDALHLLRAGVLPGADPCALGFTADDEASPETLAAVLCSGAPEGALRLLEDLFASGVGAAELADQWIAPAMQRVGHGWETKRISITGEHLATSILLRAAHGLLRALPAPPEGAPSALVAGLAHDPYLLAPLCVQLTLGEAGYAATNFGPDTPADALSEAIRECRPALVAVSFSVAETTGTGARLALVDACRASGSVLTVGGRGLRPDITSELGDAVWCRSMAELDRLARGLTAKRSLHGLAQAG